jgi:hypothetical protein
MKVRILIIKPALGGAMGGANDARLFAIAFYLLCRGSHVAGRWA